jgi:hypothetical protein
MDLHEKYTNLAGIFGIYVFFKIKLDKVIKNVQIWPFLESKRPQN